MSSRVLRVAIAGCGEVAQGTLYPLRLSHAPERETDVVLLTETKVTHLPTLALMNHLYRVTALSDISQDALDHCSTKFGVENTFTD